MKIPMLPHVLKNDPVVSFRFMVFFNEWTLAFQSVSGIGKTQDVQYFNEGGVNSHPIMLKGPQTSPHRLTFRRGIVIKTTLDHYAKYIPTLASGLLSGENALLNPNSLGLILVLDKDRTLKAMYSFISNGVVDWQVSDLDAMSNQPLIETFTISHNGLSNMSVGLGLDQINTNYFTELGQAASSMLDNF